LIPDEIKGRFGVPTCRRPVIEFWRNAGLPLTTTVGTPLNAVVMTDDRIVGLRDDADCSHVPSMNRMEFGPTSDRLETEERMVREDVRLWRSRIRGSVGLETPKT
jgi:hypothetical protein